VEGVKLRLGYSLRKLENLGTLRKSGTVRSGKVSASGWLAIYRPTEATAVLFSAEFFINMITHELLHLA